MKWRMFIAPALFGLAFVGGLIYIRQRASVPPPDPNDPTQVGQMDATVLERNLKWASDFINERYRLRQITEEQGRDYVAEYAQELTSHLDVLAISDRQAWQYGDIFRTARQWEKAESLLERAVNNAKEHKTLDRWVNDSLRLAHAKAHLGKVDEAIATARSVFGAPPPSKAPILLAVYLEVVPAAMKASQKDDLKLASLTEDAIDQHMQTQVNPDSEAGALFIAARSFHLNRSWNLVRVLYRRAGREDLALQVPAKMKRSSDKALRPSTMR